MINIYRYFFKMTRDKILEIERWLKFIQRKLARTV